MRDGSRHLLQGGSLMLRMDNGADRLPQGGSVLVLLILLVRDSFCTPPSGHPADEMLDFLISRPAPADILTFKSSPAAQARLEELLDKNREDGLSETEQLELDRYQQMNHFFILLKAHARSSLMSEN